MHGVSYDDEQVWFASGDKLNAFDPASGKMTRSLDVSAHAGTAFDGKHLFQIAEDRIQKIDLKTGRVLATIPAPGGGGDSGLAWAEGTLWVGQYRDRKNPSNRSRDRRDSSHHRIQSLRHRGHLGRWRTLARHMGRRPERSEANRSPNGRGPGEARVAAWHRRVRARVRWRRSVLLRRRPVRQGQGSPEAEMEIQTKNTGRRS